MSMFIHLSASFTELWRHLLGGFLQFHHAASGMHGHWSGLKISSFKRDLRILVGLVQLPIIVLRYDSSHHI